MDPESVEKRLHGIEKRLDRLSQQLSALVRHAFVEPQSPQERILTSRFGIHSQHEEDGLVVATFRIVGCATRSFVEIGSGPNGGNSGFLAAEFGWRGLMIDGDRGCVDRVTTRFITHPGVRPLHARVTAESINDLIGAHMTGDIDFFSLDIDGNDYWVLQALQVISPRVVMVEYNSFFGPEAAVAVPYDPAFLRVSKAGLRSLHYGASLAAMTHLLGGRGYRLILTDPTGANALFVRHDVGVAELPAVPVASAFRWSRAHAEARAEYPDPIAAFARAGLPLVPVPAGAATV